MKSKYMIPILMLLIISCADDSEPLVIIENDPFEYTSEDERACEDQDLLFGCEPIILDDLTINEENISLMNLFARRSEEDIMWEDNMGRKISSTVDLATYEVKPQKMLLGNFSCESNPEASIQYCSRVENIFIELTIPDLDARIEIELKTTRELFFSLEGYDFLDIWRTTISTDDRIFEMSYKLEPLPEEVSVNSPGQVLFPSIEINGQVYNNVLSFENSQIDRFRYYFTKEKGLFAIKDTSETIWVISD